MSQPAAEKMRCGSTSSAQNPVGCTVPSARVHPVAAETTINTEVNGIDLLRCRGGCWSAGAGAARSAGGRGLFAGLAGCDLVGEVGPGDLLPVVAVEQPLGVVGEGAVQSQRGAQRTRRRAGVGNPGQLGEWVQRRRG